MSIIGYRHTDDVDWRKKCLDAWLEYGSAPKAANALNVSHSTIRFNAWRYLLYHPDEARKIVSSEAGKHRSKMYQLEYRDMNDSEFWKYLTRRALCYLSVSGFAEWVEEFHPEQYKGVSEIYRERYPRVYAKYS